MENNKKKSKRKYAAISCKHCGEEFIPTDARQIYLDDQHRIDYNNDLRKKKNAGINDFAKRLRKNETILKNSFSSDPNRIINMAMLHFAGFDIHTYKGSSKQVITGHRILWCLAYGLAGTDNTNQTFKIIKKNNDGK